MKCDILVCGVGGQGVLSLAGILSQAALYEALYAKQSEVHGMSQRGGAVVAHVRIGDSEVASDLIPRGTASFVLGLEALESLRWVPYLSERGRVLSSVHMLKNIENYPEPDRILEKLGSYSGTLLVNSLELAHQAGNHHAENAVMAGVASLFLPMSEASFERALEHKFGSKGEMVLASVKKAFHLGRAKALESIGGV